MPLGTPNGFDALPPPEMAEHAERVGVKKAALPWDTTLMLAVLGGAFIALGGVFAVVASTGSAALPFGVARVLTGVAFSLGLVLVVVGGAELFTGNNLIVMAWVSGKIRLSQLLRNWALVYLGNLVGAVATAGLCFVAGLHQLGQGAVGEAALASAHGKLGYGFLQAFALGVLANVLVCLAVWLSFSARSTTDRILAVVPPVAAFVAAGFEHSVANMFFLPFAMAIEAARGAPTFSVGQLWLANLIPVTLGNLVGGSGLVGLVYWRIYLRRARAA